MNTSENYVATKPRLFVSLLALLASLTMMAAGSLAYAGQVVGTVINLSGPFLSKKADGTVKTLSQQSEVEQGDILVSEKTTYARIQFIDNSEIILGPSSQMKIEAFSYDVAKPENDSAKFSLITGGLRFASGALDKRSKERVSVMTPTGTISNRGTTTYIAQYIEPGNAAKAAIERSWMNYVFASVAALDRTSDGPISDAPSVMAHIINAPLRLAQNTPGTGGGSGLAAGLYVHVIDGIINLSNRGGSLNFSAGQFGYTANILKPPVIVPANPGLKFTPPPAFSSSTPPKSPSTSQGPTLGSGIGSGTTGAGSTGSGGGGKASGS